MTRYAYTALDENGDTIHGSLDTDSIEQARDIVGQMNLQITELQEADDLQATHAEPAQAVSFAPVEAPWEKPQVDAVHSEQPVQPFNTSDSSSATQENPKEALASQNTHYHPFSDTLRLYAGWLLAWYVLVYALGGYQSTRELPFRLPYVEAFLPPYSPLVLTFALASFLFLLMTSLRRLLPNTFVFGLLATVVGIGLFIVYRINV